MAATDSSPCDSEVYGKPTIHGMPLTSRPAGPGVVEIKLRGEWVRFTTEAATITASNLAIAAKQAEST